MSAQFVKVLTVGLVSAATVVGAYYGYSAYKKMSAPEERMAPTFTLPDHSGKLHGLEDYPNEWVLVHFWASWCAPCLEEFPGLLEQMRAVEGKPIRLLSISLDTHWSEAEEVYRSVLKSPPSNWVSLIDLKAKVGEEFGTYQLPETYLIAPGRKILTKWVGAQKWAGPEAKELFDQLSARPPGHK